MKTRCFFMFWLLLASIQVNAQVFKFNNFSKNFNSKSHPIEDEITDIELTNGILYASTFAGLSTYDGLSWRHLTIEDEEEEIGYLNHLYKSNSGLIYGICSRRIGIFQLNSDGKLSFKQISSRFKERIFFLSVVELEKKILFFCSDSYIEIDKNTHKYSKIEKKAFFDLGLISIANVGNKIFGLSTKKGLLNFDFKSKSFTRFKASADTLKIVYIHSYKKGELILCSKNGFIYNYQVKKNTLGKINLHKINITYTRNTGIKQAGNRILFYQGNSCFIFNNGKTEYKKTYPSLVTQAMFDNIGNLWVSTYGNGIYYEEIRSPLKIYPIKEVKLRLIKAKQGYWATERGNRILKFYPNKKQETKFFKNLGFIKELKVLDKHIFICSTQGLFQATDDGKITKLLDQSCLNIFQPSPDNHYYINDYKKIYKLHLDKNKKAVIVDTINVQNSVTDIIEFEGALFYTLEDFKGVKKITKSKYIKKQSEITTGFSNALHSIKLTAFNHSIFANHRDDIGIIDKKQNRFVSILDKIGNLPKTIKFGRKYKASFTNVAPLDKSQLLVFGNVKSQRDNFNVPGILTYEKGYFSWNDTAFKRLDGFTFNNLQKLNTNQFILNTNEMLIEFNLQEATIQCNRFDSKIRKVIINKTGSRQDSTILWGNDTVNVTHEISYIFNSVAFHFTGFSYEALERNEYSYQLVGLEDSWSNWSKEQKKEYTHLREGTYTFNVRCKNVYGTISSVDSYTFTILPPWYRTTWAYLAYALATITLLAGGSIGYSRYRSRKLRKRNRELEQVVEERTQEIRAQKEEITQQAENLKITNQELVKAHELVKQEKDEKVRIYLEEATEAVNTLQEVYEAFTLKGADFAQKLLKNEINTAGELALIREKVRQEFPDFAYQIDQALASKKITKVVWQVGHCLKLGRSPADVSKILPLGNRTVSVYGVKLRKMGILEAVKKDA